MNESSPWAIHANLRVEREPSVAEAEEMYSDYLVDENRGTFTRVISTRGLAMLEKAGVQAFEAVVGRTLPYNLTRLETGLFRRRESTANEIIAASARFGGWLKAAAKLPAVRKMVQKTQATTGVNSPYTTVDLRSLTVRFPSPGRLERLLWATKRKAEAILSAYEGQKPSWRHIADALMAEARPGKAGLIVAAMQLGFGLPYKAVAYRAARKWLVEHRSARFPQRDTTDGVVVRLAAKPAYIKIGVAVFAALKIGEYGQREHIWLVRAGERTYHAEDRGWAVLDTNWRYKNTVEGAKAAVFHALDAWKQQDQMRADEARLVAEARERHAPLVAFLDGSELGFCPLIMREDSYAAGNCRPGTEAWVMEHGWRARAFLPGPALIPHLDDDRVRRVVMAARRRRTEQEASIAA